MNNKSVQECRGCLRLVDKKLCQELFRPWLTRWAVPETLIADHLASLANIQISIDDEHSKVLCSDCYSNLAGACLFITTVQNSDSILRKRAENTTSGSVTEIDNSSWPKPILLNKNLNGSIDSRVEVEIKQEVLSEDENGSNDMDLDWEPTMDIKIEPEEIVAPVQSNIQLNGYSYDDSKEDTQQNSSTVPIDEEYLENLIKQEPLSGDELDSVPDLPLDCMLCLKAFHSVTGLKAHVIAQHSYGTVKRKTEENQSPMKKETTNEIVCATCRKCFSTRTDLMVHEASHGKHSCYVCDAKFNSFRQLSRHGARCRPRNAAAAGRTRPLSRPQSSPQTRNNSTIEEGSGEPAQKQPRHETNIDIKVKTAVKESKIEPPSKVNLETADTQSNNRLLKEESRHNSVHKLSVTAPSNKESHLEPVHKQSIIEPSNEETIVKKVQNQTQDQKVNVEQVQNQSNIESVNKTNIEPVEKHSINKETKVELVPKQTIEELLNDKVKDEPSQKLSINEPTSEETQIISVEIQPNIKHTSKETTIGNVNQAIERQSIDKSLNDNLNGKLVPQEPTAEPSIEEVGSRAVEELDIKREIEPSTDGTKVKQIQEQPGYEQSTENTTTEASFETHSGPQITSEPESTTCDSLQNLDMDPDESSQSETEMTESIEEIVARLHSEDDTEQSMIDISSTNELDPTEHNTMSQDTESESRLKPSAELETSSNSTIDEKKLNSQQDIVSSTDAVKEMEIHLAINPLSEGESLLLDTKMNIDESESLRSDGCEQKLVNVLSEISDDNVTQ